MSRDREKARRLAREFNARGDATGWFEQLYTEAAGNEAEVPWADMLPNSNLLTWLDREAIAATGKQALVIGCGLGDDAEELRRRGFKVQAFDISPTAVAWCRRRFTESQVEYQVADLLNPPTSWQMAFDFIFEANTLQALPEDLRAIAMRNLSSFLAPGGVLLVIARAREPNEPLGEVPWPLTRGEMATFTQAGLIESQFENFFDDEDPPTPRFRATYRAPLDTSS